MAKFIIFAVNDAAKDIKLRKIINSFGRTYEIFY